MFNFFTNLKNSITSKFVEAEYDKFAKKVEASEPQFAKYTDTMMELMAKLYRAIWSKNTKIVTECKPEIIELITNNHQDITALIEIVKRLTSDENIELLKTISQKMSDIYAEVIDDTQDDADKASEVINELSDEIEEIWN